MGLAALGHHYMWQNWDFLQNNPYMFIVTTIVLGIILFFGEGTIAAMFLPEREEPGSTAIIDEKSKESTLSIILCKRKLGFKRLELFYYL